MISADTIVALSSATGPAARLIIRTSGEAAFESLQSTTQQAITQNAGTAFSSLLHFADLVCPATVYVFRSPRSYTGEDLVEYHLPGNPILAEFLLKHLQSLGLRQAEAGEFTARAYFNGRIDLTQAEGVAATVAAQSEQELAAGRRLLEGELAKRLKPTADLVLSTLALLEVGIDFSDEDVTFLPTPELLSRIAGCQQSLSKLLADSTRFKTLGHEPSFVLLGRPNAGKSTLLNVLAGFDRAVASPIAGTTRDALTADVALARGFVRLIDVAGLEAGDALPADPIARQMIERATTEIAQADFVLLLTPADAVEPPPELERKPDLQVVTKIDLAGQAVTAMSGNAQVLVSAATGDGLPQLREALDAIAFGPTGASSSLALNVRHVEAIEAAMRSLSRTAELAELAGPVELIAAELREALSDIGAVLGQVTPDDLLGQVFSQFCIGK